MTDPKKLIEQVVEGTDPSELVEVNKTSPKVKALCVEATEVLNEYVAKLEAMKETAAKLMGELDSLSAKSVTYVLSRVCSSSRDVLRSIDSIKSGDYSGYDY